MVVRSRCFCAGYPISCSSAECGAGDAGICCADAPEAAPPVRETCLQGVQEQRICQAGGPGAPEVTTDSMRADVQALQCEAEKCTSADEAQCCVAAEDVTAAPFTSCGAIQTEDACGPQAIKLKNEW